MKAFEKKSVQATALGLGLLIAAIGAAAAGASPQASGDPVLYRPVPGRKEVSLPRGEVLLVEFLQALACSTGMTVCFKGDDPPQTKLTLPRALDALDARTAAEILDANGYELSTAAFKGQQVSWVQRLLIPPRQKGKIVRAGGTKDDDDGKASEPEPLRGVNDRTEGGDNAASVGLYTRDSGSGPRYVVILETDDRSDAEEAISLLKAHRDSRTGKKARGGERER